MEMTLTSTDRIEQQIRLKATRTRVWRALTIPTEFGKWFGVTLTGDSVRPGTVLRGPSSCGNGDKIFEATVEAVEPEVRYSLRWHPYAVEPGEPTTLITFTLEDVPGGTLLNVVETGFDKVPAARRAKSFEMNTKGWTMQMENIARYLTAA
ncbi:MAG: SRPBCC family protein [Betaproteobacteria bacterium]